MDQGDICICGHIRDVHFWGPCSTVGCLCEQFVVVDLAIDIFKALKKATVLVRSAYKTPQWLTECRSEESDAALDFIEQTLVRADNE